MKTLAVERREIDYKAYVKRFANEKDFSVFIDEPTIVTENGEIKIVYLELDMDSSDIVGALQRTEFQTSYRTAGMKSTRRVFGWQPKIALRRDFCTATSLATEMPAEHAIICNYAEKACNAYREHNPALFEKHAALLRERESRLIIQLSVASSQAASSTKTVNSSTILTPETSKACGAIC